MFILALRLVLFALYDFDESGVLTLDEMILCYRSALSGACKICKINPPLEGDIEQTVAIGFDSIRKDQAVATDPVAFAGIDRESFVHFCLDTPDITAWIEYFDDLKEFYEGRTLLEPIMLKADNSINPADPTPIDEAYMNHSIGGTKLLEIESSFTKLPHKAWRNVLPFINGTHGGNKNQTKPSKNLELDWVYGYNAHSSMKSIFYTTK
jgi:hypothetical protein